MKNPIEKTTARPNQNQIHRPQEGRFKSQSLLFIRPASMATD
jgi:hypothetical protein